jgi:hypothetical protein
MTLLWRRKIDTECARFFWTRFHKDFYFCFTLRSLIRIRFQLLGCWHTINFLRYYKSTQSRFCRLREAKLRLYHFSSSRWRKKLTQMYHCLLRERRRKVLSSVTHEILWLSSGEITFRYFMLFEFSVLFPVRSSKTESFGLEDRGQTSKTSIKSSKLLLMLQMVRSFPKKSSLISKFHHQNSLQITPHSSHFSDQFSSQTYSISVSISQNLNFLLLSGSFKLICVTLWSQNQLWGEQTLLKVSVKR